MLKKFLDQGAQELSKDEQKSIKGGALQQPPPCGYVCFRGCPNGCPM